MAGFDKYLEECGKYAKENGFKLNPNPDASRGIVFGLFKNEEKYGHKYCPCRRVAGNEQEDAKNICPCIYHKDEIKKDGHCFCRLYWRKDV
ncbi:MAG: ferredoxin-thioredoxin reductase catalytic domain-containing protein [bacterium]|nr:ferredoxin-thioredoxin reductase catalytic domain-containing protein [bacterium]